MPILEQETIIHAPIERCFDLARSIDFHVAAAAETQERAVRGRISGFINAGERVTWRAKHLGVWQEMTVEVTASVPPRYFRDVMIDGPFAVMEHEHYFLEREGATAMLDKFLYRFPFGGLGVLFDKVFLARYMRRFLEGRALSLKSAAESDEWRKYFDAQ